MTGSSQQLYATPSFARGVLAAAVVVLWCVAAPSSAVTTGPAQPEFTSWSPAARTDMVNLSSGDFQPRSARLQLSRSGH